MPVIRVDPVRIGNRAKVFEQAGALVARIDVLAEHRFRVLPALAQATAEIYFMLSDLLKAETFDDPAHFTDHTKVAALTAICIAQCKPFRPAMPIAIDEPAFEYANPILAMRLGAAKIRHRFELRAWDDRKRFYDTLRHCDLRAISEYVELTRAGERSIGDDFSIDLTREDHQKIRLMINKFVVLRDMKILRDPY